MTERSFILDPSRNSNEANRIREANLRLKAILHEHCPAGVGFVLVVFDSPLSLRRPQVALNSDHDAATIERILAGIVEQIRRQGAP